MDCRQFIGNVDVDIVGRQQEVADDGSLEVMRMGRRLGVAQIGFTAGRNSEVPAAILCSVRPPKTSSPIRRPLAMMSTSSARFRAYNRTV